MTTGNLSLRSIVDQDPRVIELTKKLKTWADKVAADATEEAKLQRKIDTIMEHLHELRATIEKELQQEVATGTPEVAPKVETPKAPKVKKTKDSTPLIVKAEAQSKAAAQGILLSAEQGIPTLPAWMSAAQGIPKGTEEVQGDLSISSPTPSQDKEAHAPTHVPTLSTAERAYAESIVNGDREELRSYLLSGTPEECVIAVLFEYLPKGKKAPSKSTHPNPCQAVWELASNMKGAKRSEVVAAAVAIGVGEATARTQYQKWYEAGRKK